MNRQNTRDMDQDFDQNYQGNRGYRGDYDRESGDWYGGSSNRGNYGGQGWGNQNWNQGWSGQGGYHPGWSQQGWNQGWSGQGYGQGGYSQGWNPRWGGQDYYGQGYGYNFPYYGSQGWGNQGWNQGWSGQGGYNQGWGNQGWNQQGQQGWNQGWSGQSQGWNNRRWQNRWPQNDQEIEDYIYDAIDDDPNVSNEADINVDVNDGIVTLTGTVRSWRTKYTAGNCAWMAPGVRDVNNNISVAGRTRGANKSGFNTGQTAMNGTNMKDQNTSTGGRK